MSDAATSQLNLGGLLFVDRDEATLGGGDDGPAAEPPPPPPPPPPPHVADAFFDRDVRVVVLLALLIAGVVGGAGVIVWLSTNRKRRYRVNVIILNVTLTDLLVVCFACGMQVVWELVDREWRAGDALCRLLKWAQSFALISSNYMLIVLAVDRHFAIRSPMKEPISVLKMIVCAWSVGAVLSLPQVFVFRQNFVTTEGSIFKDKTVCESVFRDRPISHRQAYLTFISLVVFFVPVCVIGVCYVRIYLKIADKVPVISKAGGGEECRRLSWRPGTLRLHGTKSNSLAKAKLKTLRMTVVIVVCFVVCGLPYHVLEAVMSYGDHTAVSGAAMAVFGAMAVANSAVNPYVFLCFNANPSCVRRLALGQNLELRSGAQTVGTTDKTLLHESLRK